MCKKVIGTLCSSGLFCGNDWDGCEQLGRYMERCIFLLLCFHLWIAGGEWGLSYPLIRRCREASVSLRGVLGAIVALMQRQLPFCVRICCNRKEAFCALVALSLSLEAKTHASPHYARHCLMCSVVQLLVPMIKYLLQDFFCRQPD